jgi:hypothetical protein
MQYDVIKNVLGTTKEVNEAQSGRFYRRLQHFVDNKEKQTGDKKAPKELEYWPLIKVQIALFSFPKGFSNESFRSSRST